MHRPYYIYTSISLWYPWQCWRHNTCVIYKKRGARVCLCISVCVSNTHFTYFEYTNVYRPILLWLELARISNTRTSSEARFTSSSLSLFSLSLSYTHTCAQTHARARICCKYTLQCMRMFDSARSITAHTNKIYVSREQRPRTRSCLERERLH